MMATPEEHYTEALHMASMAAQAMAAVDVCPTPEVLALAQLHVALGQLKLELDRPGRNIILPNHR
jgi:hypothetical protein